MKQVAELKLTLYVKDNNTPLTHTEYTITEPVNKTAMAMLIVALEKQKQAFLGDYEHDVEVEDDG
jgi:hypothetical protein